IADKPGTWLFHCQVSDHMEVGMMATYTIYRLARQPCPVQFVSGEFWRRNGKFTIDVENRSRKIIRNLVITSGNLLTPQYMRPYVGDWTWNKPILPGQKQTLEMKDYLRDSDDIPAWAFYPTKIVYEDGTEWKPQESGECFHVFWRDKKHPQ